MTVESELTGLMFAEVCTCVCACILIKVNMSLCSHVTLIFIACVLLLPAEGCRNTTNCRIRLFIYKQLWMADTDIISNMNESDAVTRLTLFG